MMATTTTRLFTLPTSPMKPNVLQPSFKGNNSDAVVSTTNPDNGGGSAAVLKPLVVTAADSTAGNENREGFTIAKDLYWPSHLQ